MAGFFSKKQYAAIIQHYNFNTFIAMFLISNRLYLILYRVPFLEAPSASLRDYLFYARQTDGSRQIRQVNGGRILRNIPICDLRKAAVKFVKR